MKAGLFSAPSRRPANRVKRAAELGGARRNARIGLRRGDDLQPEPIAEIGPAVVHDHDLSAAIGLQRSFPFRDFGMEARKVRIAVCLEDCNLGRPQRRKRSEDRRGDRPRVVRIEPIMRVALGMHMRLALDPQALRFGLEQPDCL